MVSGALQTRVGHGGPLPRWELYRLLADQTRLRLLALTAREELAVSELAELLREGQPKVSRHASALRDAGLLSARKQGTWLLLRLAPGASEDAVVADALAAGGASCDADGTTERVGDVVAARDLTTREFFARGGRPPRAGPPAELAAYLHAIATLVEPRDLAVDAGTGDGALLEVLAPIFHRVVALDRSSTQLELAAARATRRGFGNVQFVQGEIDGPEVRQALRELAAKGSPHHRRRGSREGADAVVATRLLHHAAVPSRTMHALTDLARPAVEDRRGGAVFVLDYESHHDEALRAQQADLWLGFAPSELVEMAEQAGLRKVSQTRLPQSWCGEGPDRHVSWQLVGGFRGPEDQSRRAARNR